MNFQDAIRALDLTPPANIVPGKLYRFPGKGKHQPNDSARCKLFEDGKGGWIADYSRDIRQLWHADSSHFTESERQALKEQIEISRKERELSELKARNDAALKAQKLWKRAVYADVGNQYLYRKKSSHTAQNLRFWS